MCPNQNRETDLSLRHEHTSEENLQLPDVLHRARVCRREIRMRHDRGHRPRTGPAVATAADSCQEGEVEDRHPHGNIPGDAERGVAQVLAGGLLQTVLQRPRATAAAGSGLRRHTDTQGKHRTLVGRMPDCGLQHREGPRDRLAACLRAAICPHQGCPHHPDRNRPDL